DSRVPATWLLDHLAAARDGALLALGRVLPAGAGADLAPEALQRWLHEHADGERHVFGANLGVRTDAYLLAGGFPPFGTGEDVALVEAVDHLGDLLPHTEARIVELPHSVVRTSGRTDGRTPGGFAGYLRLLVENGPTP
ncbi:MAG: glycosyltransferase family 2 protein, partial [Herbiconiux sp.]|nr:glycosyltransferase family 2 protein [Herbiconiux sp.]